jgi:RNA polymerase-binding transcription factor DksA
VARKRVRGSGLPAGGARNPAVVRKSTKKKVTKRKTSSKKKVSARAASATSKKRTTSKKKTLRKKSTTRKTGTKKKTKAKTAKKTAPRKTVSKKTKKKSPTKTVKKAGSRKTTGKGSTAGRKTTKSAAGRGKPPPKTATSTKKTGAAKTPRKKSQSRPRSLGAQSVAEAASAAKADAEGYVIINGRRVRMISTKGQVFPRKSRVTQKAEAETIQPAEETKPIKTKLTAKELRYYRNLLMVKRAELVGDLSAMETAALEARMGNLSNLPIHMADIGTDTYDQDFILGLAEKERQRLVEIDDALRRISDKTYGICQMTGKPIPKTRLNAKPWAKYTIEAARALEGQWRS